MKHIIIGLLLLPMLALAQTEKDIPAEVIFKKDNREKGLIRYKAWINNPASMTFTGADGKQVLLEPAAVKEVHIDGKDVYIARLVTRYTNSLTTQDLTYDAVEPSVNEELFLRQLVKGNRVSLYVFRDVSRTNYFLVDSTGRVETLRYLRFLKDNDGTTSMLERKTFQEQLMPYLRGGDEKGKKMLYSAAWKDEDMIALFAQLNDQTGPVYAAEELKKNRRDQRIFVGAGAALVNYSFESVDPIIDAMTFTSSVNPQFWAGYRFTGSRRASRLSLQFVTGYLAYKTTGTSYRTYRDQPDVKETLDISNSSLIFSLDALYAPVKTPSFTWDIGLSFHFIYTLKNDTERKSTATDINGQPIYVPPVELANNQRINWGITSQCMWKSGHGIRFNFRPFQETSDFGGASPKDQVISLGYQYNFRL